MSSCAPSSRPVRDSTLSAVTSAPTIDAGRSRRIYDGSFGSTFFARGVHIRAIVKNRSGESEMPDAPMASIKNPAAIEQTRAVF